MILDWSSNSCNTDTNICLCDLFAYIQLSTLFHVTVFNLEDIAFFQRCEFVVQLQMIAQPPVTVAYKSINFIYLSFLQWKNINVFIIPCYKG